MFQFAHKSTSVLLSTCVLWVAVTNAADPPPAPPPAATPHQQLPGGQTDHAAAVVDSYFAAAWEQQNVTPAGLIFILAMLLYCENYATFKIWVM